MKLDIGKAKKELKWYPVYGVKEAIKQTMSWYKAYYEGINMLEFSLDQILLFQKKISKVL